MKEKNEPKGLGKLFANIRAFFSRKKKEQIESKKVDETVSIDSSTGKVEPVLENIEITEPVIDALVEDIIEEPTVDDIATESESVLEPEENVTEAKDTKTVLTPQQEYVANRNMKVSASETTIRSFIAKMSLVNRETQEYYSELKNYVLSFEGTRCRTSWQYDSFYKTRILLARFVVRGKSLWLYVALTPEDIPAGTNCSFTKDRKYEGIEAGIKIQGQRTLKQSKTLLRLACEKIGLNYVERESVDYIPPRMTEEEMLEKGLIKKILTSTNARVE